MEPLGSDEYGRWFGARAGILLQRGFEEPVVQPHDFVVLVPADGSWIASWNGPGETDVSVYVDVTSRPSVQPDVVSAIDLVARLAAGTEPFATVGSAWLQRFVGNG